LWIFHPNRENFNQQLGWVPGNIKRDKTTTRS
jgi:hypothetical protein